MAGAMLNGGAIEWDDPSSLAYLSWPFRGETTTDTASARRRSGPAIGGSDG